MSVKKTVENVYLRQDAVLLTRKFFWPLVGLTILFNIVVNVATKALNSLGDDIMYTEITALTQAINYYANSKTMTSTDPVVNAVIALIVSPKFWLYNLFYMVVTGLLYAGLTLGRCRECLDAVRGGVVSAKGVFSLMRYSFKGWRLYLLTAFKTALWTLPGLAVIVLALFLPESNFTYAVVWLGLILIFALSEFAALGYILAPFIICDEPDTGVIASIRLSKKLMKGRRWQRFKVVLPPLLKFMGVVFLVALVFELVMIFCGISESNLSNNIELILCNAASIYFYLQSLMVEAAFFEKVRWPNPEDKPAKPTSYWLRDHSAHDPAKAAPISAWLEEHTATDIEPDDAAESTDAPEEADASPEDTNPETNEEKENPDEQPVC